MTRSAAFCARLKLPPSKGPYVLVTTEYPGAGVLRSYPESFPADLEGFLLEFNNADASEIMRVLNALADQLVVSGLPPDSQSPDYGRTWQRNFEVIRNTLVGLSKNITLKIKTPFLEAETKF